MKSTYPTVSALALFCCCLAGLAHGADPRSVPAVFEKYLSLPGQVNHFKKPGRVVFDESFGETYVADIGNNRVLIFDTSLALRFEFYTASQVNSPLDLAVTDDGRMHVMGNRSGVMKVCTFDYDGLFLTDHDLTLFSDSPIPVFSSIAAARGNRLLILEEQQHEIIMLDSSFKKEKTIDLAADLAPKIKKEMIYGSLFVRDTLIYLPYSTLGYVSIYSVSGHHISDVGIKGNGIGHLNMPVSVSVNEKGIIQVLDRNRFNVVCYSHSGEFLGEFGGKGHTPGWFYHPDRLAGGSGSRVLIGQLFNNLIQVCRLPDFIYARSVTTELPGKQVLLDSAENIPRPDSTLKTARPDTATITIPRDTLQISPQPGNIKTVITRDTAENTPRE